MSLLDFLAPLITEAATKYLMKNSDGYILKIKITTFLTIKLNVT
jgi:hypothetical protein